MADGTAAACDVYCAAQWLSLMSTQHCVHCTMPNLLLELYGHISVALPIGLNLGLAIYHACPCVLQDIDVETLMQEIKQWGPQDQAAPPADRPLDDEPDSHTPRRVRASQEEQPVTSPSASLTPNQAVVIQEQSPSSHDKVRQGCFLAYAHQLWSPVT